MSLPAAPPAPVEVSPQPPGPDTEDITNLLAHEASVLRLETFRLARRLRVQRAIDSMSDGQFAVLAVLRAHVCCISTAGSWPLTELAEHERVTAPSMNRTINCLAEDGYIERVTDEIDRRKVNILLTTEGDAVVTETIRQRNAWLTQVLSELAPEQRATLASASEIMREIAKR